MWAPQAQHGRRRQAPAWRRAVGGRVRVRPTGLQRRQRRRQLQSRGAHRRVVELVVILVVADVCVAELVGCRQAPGLEGRWRTGSQPLPAKATTSANCRKYISLTAGSALHVKSSHNSKAQLSYVHARIKLEKELMQISSKYIIYFLKTHQTVRLDGGGLSTAALDASHFLSIKGAPKAPRLILVTIHTDADTAPHDRGGHEDGSLRHASSQAEGKL